DVVVQGHLDRHRLEILRCGSGFHFLFLGLDVHCLNSFDHRYQEIQPRFNSRTHYRVEPQAHSAFSCPNCSNWRKDEQQQDDDHHQDQPHNFVAAEIPSRELHTVEHFRHGDALLFGIQVLDTYNTESRAGRISVSSWQSPRWTNRDGQTVAKAACFSYPQSDASKEWFAAGVLDGHQVEALPAGIPLPSAANRKARAKKARCAACLRGGAPSVGIRSSDPVAGIDVQCDLVSRNLRSDFVRNNLAPAR